MKTLVCLQFQFTRPRGARLNQVGEFINGNRFNSRAREGRDHCRRAECNRLFCFNSRAREGRDTQAMRLMLRAPCFNSRAREGRDSMGFYLPIFICLQRFFCETFLFFYFYIHFRIVIFRNLLNINMCESPGFFCALRVRLCKIALILYHFICRLNKIYLFYGRSRVAM